MSLIQSLVSFLTVSVFLLNPVLAGGKGDLWQEPESKGDVRKTEREIDRFRIGIESGKWLPVTCADSQVRVAGELFFGLVTSKNRAANLYPLRAPGGIPVTRGYPIDPQPGEPRDHPHHRSFWIAHGDINGVDYWTGKGEIASTGPRVLQGEGRDQLTITEATELLKDGESTCRMSFLYRIQAIDQARWIDCRITAEAIDEEVTFGDTKEGFFALRLHPDLQLKADPRSGVNEVFGQAMNSEGDCGAEVWGKRAKWVCYQGPVNERNVSVVIMDHPSNLQHPTTWHARDYGLFAANPFGLHDFLGKEVASGAHVVRKNNPLVFRYRVLLRSELIDAAEIDWWYQEFLASFDVE